MKQAVRAGGRVVVAFLAALAREIGPREVGILAMAAGVYLAVRALWDEGALGVCLVVAGALVVVFAEMERRDAARAGRQE